MLLKKFLILKTVGIIVNGFEFCTSIISSKLKSNNEVKFELMQHNRAKMSRVAILCNHGYCHCFRVLQYVGSHLEIKLLAN